MTLMTANVPEVVPEKKRDWIDIPTPSFFEDEEGMETIEKVLTIFVAAIILIALIAVFNHGIFDKVKEKLIALFNSSAT